MIVCEGFFSRSNCPKYLQPVCLFMQNVNESAFLENMDNFELWYEALEKLLKKCKIKGSTAHFGNTHLDCDRGQISLYAKAGDQDVTARLCFFRVKSLLEYDEETRHFEDVSERFQ